VKGLVADGLMGVAGLVAAGAVAALGFALVDTLFAELQDELIDRHTGANGYRGFELDLRFLAGTSLFAAAMVAGATGLSWVARWLSRQSLEAQVQLDPRPPILFLRSFGNDQVRFTARSGLRGLFERAYGGTRLDHILVQHFSRYGPVVALGQPGERDLPFGAARVYVPNEQWQELVQRLARQALAVIIVADATHGVEWEISAMLAGENRHKTVLLGPPARPDVRTNDIVSAAFGPSGRDPEPSCAVAAWMEGPHERVLVRAEHAVTPATYVVALQAFFRRTAPPGPATQLRRSRDCLARLT